MVAVEIEAEEVLYSKDEAVEIIEKLYRVGKVSASERGVNETVEAKPDWLGSKTNHSLKSSSNPTLA